MTPPTHSGDNHHIVGRSVLSGSPAVSRPMTRAATVCPIPGCPELAPCPHHPRAPRTSRRPWAASSRLSRLPVDWYKTRARVLRRDRRICWICNGPGADAVDHVIPGDDHSESNLRAVHHNVAPYCHRRKSSAEGHAARRTLRGTTNG